MFDTVFWFGFRFGFGLTTGGITFVCLVLLILLILRIIGGVLAGFREHRCQGGTQ